MRVTRTAFLIRVIVAAVVLAVALDACRSMQQPFSFAESAADTDTVEQLHRDVATATHEVEHRFGRVFSKHFEVIVAPTRSAFDAALPPDWGLKATECWMVAAGVADRLWILSPAVWREQACDHDPSDTKHVHGIVAHELVHVFHGQSNPSDDFSALEGIDWFAEGLAVYMSGQLEESHMLAAADALHAGAMPARLADAWTGKYRYGVSGSLVRYLDRRVGRSVFLKMLGATSQAEILSLAGLTESELIAEWRANVAQESVQPKK